MEKSVMAAATPMVILGNRTTNRVINWSGCAKDEVSSVSACGIRSVGILRFPKGRLVF